MAAPKLVWVAFALVFAGGFSNLIDRLALGYVIDFIDFGFWPAFNFADAAITIAVVLLLFYELKPLFSKVFKRRKRLKERKV